MIWLTHWRAIAAVAALAGAFGGGYALCLHQWRVVDLRAANARLTADLAKAHKDALIVRKYYTERDAINATFDGQGRDFGKMEGRDAPLSDHLRAVSRQLWP